MFELTLSGPGKNALSTKMMCFIQEKLQEAKGAPILLQGKGDVFCAGLDLKEVSSLDQKGMKAFLTRLEDMMESLYLYPAPTVALVNGHAIAGGCFLALCCDHRVSTPDHTIKIGLNEVALGLQFPPRLHPILKNRIPRQFLSKILLGATLFNPSVAYDIGLLDELAADAPSVARARLKELSLHPKDAYAACKSMIREKIDVSKEEQNAFETAGLRSWTNDSLKERIQKVLNRSSTLRHIRAPVISVPETEKTD